MASASKLKKLVRKLGYNCSLLPRAQSPNHPPDDNISTQATTEKENVLAVAEESDNFSKNPCAICLEPLGFEIGESNSRPVFVAECSHAFHFVCISSNVRHGSLTCPICRASWAHLPRTLMPSCSVHCNVSDPVFQILDDSIASFRFHRLSSLQSACYNDDDPIEPDSSYAHPRLCISILLVPSACQSLLDTYGHSPLSHFSGSSCNTSPNPSYLCSDRAYLFLKLTPPEGMDLVLVASTAGPHLRLLKQWMALAVFCLRPVDRLAIVTYSSAASRALPLRRMTSHGKRIALQVIDRPFYLVETDPSEGIKKGLKILQDRTYQNSHCCILHLSDCPSRTSFLGRDMQVPIPVHCFHVGHAMHKFEEFLDILFGGLVRDIKLRIGKEGLVRLGELRGGEERRIPLHLVNSGFVQLHYSYVECGAEERLRSGETVITVNGMGERSEGGHRDLSISGRTSCVGRWEYHDPYMARRWAKHLHGYRL